MANCKKCGKSVVSGIVLHSECWAEILKQKDNEIKMLKARLENAIELPCKVGDTVYCINEFLQEIQVWKIKTISYHDHDRFGINLKFYTHDRKGNFMALDNLNLNKTWFSTREQAEARLKESEDDKL